MISEIIPIWKPIDWTSFDVVKKIRSQIKPSKVGHAGSLDPFAEGILMLCTGRCTKSVELLMDKEKEYIATIELGSETDSLDLTGKVVENKKVPKINNNDIIKVLNSFIGRIKQLPPMFSALKVNGQPLYKAARKGIVLPRKERRINVYDIKLIKFYDKYITIRVICGRGTYIRTLAKDIALKLDTVGHLVSLKRTRVGEFDEINCMKIEDFPKWISTLN